MLIMMTKVLMLTMMTKVSIEPVERWERGILALKIIDELTMWFFTIGQDDVYYDYADYDDEDYDCIYCGFSHSAKMPLMMMSIIKDDNLNQIL